MSQRFVHALFLAAVVFLVASAVPAHAQYGSAAPWSWNVKLGYSEITNEGYPSGSVGFSMAGYYNMPEKPALGLGFEFGWYALGDKTFPNIGGFGTYNAGISASQLTGQFRVRKPEGPVHPYLEGGAGVYTYFAGDYPGYYGNWKTYFGVNGGVGLQIGNGPLRFDAAARYHNSFRSGEDPHMVTFMGGVSYN